MRPVIITKNDGICGFDRKFVIRPSKSNDGWFLAEVDPDFGNESLMGYFETMDAAIARIDMVIGK